MTCGDVRIKLTPYVDSELPVGEQAEFESHLRSCAACAADALSLMQLKRATRASATRYAPTPEFRLRMEKAMRAQQKSAWPAIWFPKLVMASAAAVLLIASIILWTTHFERERALAELTDMHVATLASANPVDVVSTDRHTVKPWFAGKIPFSFNLPELQNSEFTLDGGRVAYFHHSPGAQLLFHVRKHQLSVFIFQQQSAGVPFSVGGSTASKLAFHTETWSEGGLRYFIVSDAPASDVHALGELLKNAARS
jgi:anti-sigma factor RsiW